MVPVDETDEADEAEEESSSMDSGSSEMWSVSCSSSSSSKVSLAMPNLAFAQARCRSLMMGHRLVRREKATSFVEAEKVSFIGDGLPKSWALTQINLCWRLHLYIWKAPSFVWSESLSFGDDGQGYTIGIVRRVTEAQLRGTVYPLIPQFTLYNSTIYHIILQCGKLKRSSRPEHSSAIENFLPIP